MRGNRPAPGRLARGLARQPSVHSGEPVHPREAVVGHAPDRSRALRTPQPDEPNARRDARQSGAIVGTARVCGSRSSLPFSACSPAPRHQSGRADLSRAQVFLRHDHAVVARVMRIGTAIERVPGPRAGPASAAPLAAGSKRPRGRPEPAQPTGSARPDPGPWGTLAPYPELRGAARPWRRPPPGGRSRAPGGLERSPEPDRWSSARGAGPAVRRAKPGPSHQ